MCGICGFYSKSVRDNQDLILKMNSSIQHRGPDSSGFWIDDNFGIVLGHQRLSILDLSKAGDQPIRSNSGRFILIFNGEIYNHLEIRNKLLREKANTYWKGSSDTETLVEALEFWGLNMTLNKIEGMFAFALWDQKLKKLSLARDRIGEKPLYYGYQNEGTNKVFLFGSELKALKAHPKFQGEINRDSIASLLHYNYIPSPYSIYKNIFKLKPGFYIELEASDLQRGLLPPSKDYWSLIDKKIFGINNQINLNKSKIKDDLKKNLQLAVKKQMISDVPVGAFLSGGIDSSTIVSLMQSQSNKKIKTFTIGFNESDYDEAKHSKKIANYLGTEHNELVISSKNALDLIPKIPITYDEPFSDSSQIPTFLLSQFASQNVKVALTGDGGDELFCGYNRHIASKTFSRFFTYTPKIIRKILSHSLLSISNQNIGNLFKFSKYQNINEKLQKISLGLGTEKITDLYKVFTTHWENPTQIVLKSKEQITLENEIKTQLSHLDIQQEMMALDFLTYLPDDILVKVDRAAMASSLETRVPFLDHKLIEYVFKIPNSFIYRKGQGKFILREILNEYIPKNFFERPKKGFGVPIDSWLRGPLRDWGESLLEERKLNKEEFFNTKLIRKKWDEHISGKRNWQSHLWSVLMFQSWKDTN